MKGTLLILFFILMVFAGFAQNDTTKTTKQIKEAPVELQNLLNRIIKEETEKMTKDADLEIDGLLVDDTKTKSGKDFYDLFYQQWEAPAGAKNYTIFIIEKPFRLTTTMIEILINETMVYQSFLQPRYDYIETLTEQAVSQTALYLRNYEEIVRELDGNDRSGTGIY
jgi:curli production assembly/transport component CsgE